MSTTSPTSEVVYEIGPPSAATAAGGTGRISRFWRGPETDPRWARPGLLALLAAAAVLYLWDLSASGWANSFYAAAVQAGTKSWKAMLFGSLDAGNAITVDKPPASLWVMEISGRIFGFSSWSMLVPQALMGVATCGVVYAAVKRVLTRSRSASIGAAAGLLAAAALMVTPVAVLMFKFNNPDALLVLLMTLAVYAVVRAQESGSTRWLVLAGTLIGFAFLTKTLQAFLILPALTAVYLATGPGRFVRRLGQIGAAGLAIVVSAGWWVALAQLWPAGSRPYIGGSQDNSFLSLTFGYNGFGRLTGNETGSVGGGGGFRRGLEGLPGAPGTTANGGFQFIGPGGQTITMPGGGGAPRGGGPGGFSSGTGIGRMFDSEIGSQVSWLLPAALVLFVFGLWAAGRSRRTDHARSALLAWGLSLLSTAAVFSYMQGIFHPYYTIALAPLIAVTLGIGAGMLWARRSEPLARIGLAGAVGVTAWWSYHLLAQTPDWYSWMRYVIAVVGAVGVVLLLAGPGWLRAGAAVESVPVPDAPVEGVAQPGWVPGAGSGSGSAPASAPAAGAGAAAPAAAVAAARPVAASEGSRIKGLWWVAVAIGVGAALLGPAAYAVATTSTGHTGSIPSAGPAGAGFGGPGGFGGGGNGRRFMMPGGGQGFFLGGAPGGQAGQTGQAGQGGTTGLGGSPGQGGQNGQTGGTQGGPLGGTQNQQGGGTTTNQFPFPVGGGGFTREGGGMNNFLDASTPGARPTVTRPKAGITTTNAALAVSTRNVMKSWCPAMICSGSTGVGVASW